MQAVLPGRAGNERLAKVEVPQAPLRVGRRVRCTGRP